MKFKNWLLNEDGFAGAGGNSWDVLYPTYADDYPHVSRAPLDHMWLQWRWRRGLELGRTLHNIDNDEFQRRGYTSIESTSAPPAGDGKGWKHRSDKEQSSLRVVQRPSLLWIRTGKTANQTKELTPEEAEGCRLWSSAGATGYEPDYDLDSIFHDEPEHKWPDIDEKYMDAPFKKQYEHAFAEFMMSGGGFPVDTPFGGPNNANMPVRSKFVTDDGGRVGAKKEEKPKTADFGFDRRPREKPRAPAIDKRKGRLLRVDRPDMA